MFNTHQYITNKTHLVQGPERIDIHEHKAPTDDSIRLAKEIEEKLKKDIVARFSTDNNILQFHSLYFCPQMAAYDTYEIGYNFVLNNNYYTDTFILDRKYNDTFEDRKELMYQLYLTLAKNIAELILNQELTNPDSPVYYFVNKGKYGV